MTLRTQMSDTPLEPAYVQIADDYPPALDGGTYTLTITQTITAPAAATYSQPYVVTVAGPRFSVEPALLQTRFPPQNGRGVFYNYLPQVVFTRGTLPWERTLDGSPPGAGTAATPYLALLVLDGDAPQPQVGTVADLLGPPHLTLGPNLKEGDLDPGESTKDVCLYVDIPTADFLVAVPRVEDLQYLAHSRKVDVTAKPTPVTALDGWFSVVIANRFPARDVSNTAYLVSLEGFADYLPTVNGQPALPDNPTAVRFAVFESWSFVDTSLDGDFLALMGRLTTGPLATPPLGACTSADGQDAAAALAMGYGAFNHTTRQGEHAVSWYRGPLVPLPVQQEQVQTWPVSDAALRFDPVRGMLDVSYASAWQLGRLLGLGDGQFGRVLYEWRRAHQRSAVQLAQRLAVAMRLPWMREGASARELLGTHFVRDRISDVMANRIGPALLGHDLRTPPGAVGPVADPTGLHATAHRLPGLVPEETRAQLRGHRDGLGEAILGLIGRVARRVEDAE